MNGYRTDDLIREELPLVAVFRPTLVTVLIGANDIVAASSDDRFRAQLRRILSSISADVPAAALCALPQPDWSQSPGAASFGAVAAIAARIERFNVITREEVELVRGMYVDIFPLMRAQAMRCMFAPDGLHPSAAAYAEWADELREQLPPGDRHPAT